MNNTDAMDIIKLIWPLIVLQLGLQIYALTDILRRKNSKYLPKTVWIVIILIGQILGASAYLLIGRAEEE